MRDNNVIFSEFDDIEQTSIELKRFSIFSTDGSVPNPVINVLKEGELYSVIQTLYSELS